eukprot:GHVR01143484.1.p1 GENE.GHVR01143484.1~~GHVR01143484.1.p1  ORF type:complete len:156 (-),score=22.28 GHVR01143484.1:165-632(-)
MVTKKTEGQVITDELYYNDRAELCPLCVCETLNVMGPLELLFKVNGKTNGEIMRHDHEKYNIQSTWDKLQGNLATLRRNSAGNLATSRRSSAVGRSGVCVFCDSRCDVCVREGGVCLLCSVCMCVRVCCMRDLLCCVRATCFVVCVCERVCYASL